MATKWEISKGPRADRENSLKGQKTFKGGKLPPQGFKDNKVREEHDAFIQYDKPNEAV